MLVAIVTFLLILGPIYLFYGIVFIFMLPFLAVKKAREARNKKGYIKRPIYPFF